ncbi:MAG TPA: hypothetical protein DCF68_12715 [Cyanothece sp. UBA12306]|nr:hypothetical protein [Cyanothece sp. UBA12306]
MLKFIDRFRWKGSEQIYTLPWLKNRIEFSANPDRIREYARSCPFTRSRLSMTILKRFHLSNHSIVVSDDEHAHFLRKHFLQCMPDSHQFPEIAEGVVYRVLQRHAQGGTMSLVNLSSEVIREVYRSLLLNLLGVEILKPLEQYIDNIVFKPRTKLMHTDGLMYALGLQFPGFGPMRTLVEMVFFKGDHYMRKVARQLEDMVFIYSIPKQGSWFSALLELKASGNLSTAQFRGEITSTLVSAYALSSAISSMLLCLAARQEYIDKINNGKAFAHYFVKEVLRLYPPFQQFGYEQEGIWDGAQYPTGKGTDLFVFTYGLHRNPRFWKDPEEFYPERFLTPRSSSDYKFLPFGVGQRSCVGRSYSMAMLVALLEYLCSDECGLALLLPDDFVANNKGMPIGLLGRLVSFPVDDRIYVGFKEYPNG